MNEDSRMRTLIWEYMLSADLNHRYYSRLASRFQVLDRNSKVFLAVATSTVVSGWAIWGKPGLNWIWQVTSGLATLVAIVLPIWDPAKSMKEASRLSAIWFSALRNYELLWTQVDDLQESSARQECERILALETQAVDLEHAIAEDRKLMRSCERAVRTARGLPAIQ